MIFPFDNTKCEQTKLPVPPKTEIATAPAGSSDNFVCAEHQLRFLNAASILVLCSAFLFACPRVSGFGQTTKASQKKSTPKPQESKKKTATPSTTSAKKAAKPQTKPQAHKTKLHTLRQEIERDRAKLRAVKVQEQQTTKTIENFREKGKKLQTSLQKISSKLTATQDSLQKTTKKITTTEMNASEMRRRYAALVRAVGGEQEASAREYVALRGAMEQELITQGVVRSLAASAEERLGRVQRARDSLSEARERYRFDFTSLASVKNLTESQRKHLESVLEARQKELRDLQANKQQLIRQIEEKKASARKMESIIAGMVGKAGNGASSASSRHSSSDNGEKNQALYEARAAGVRGGFRRHSLPFPVESRRILQTFGSHVNPVTGSVTENPGIDIQAAEGSTVRSVAKGVVSLVNWLPGYGSLVIIDHGNTFRTVYANLASVGIAQGSAVKAGTVLGRSGRSADGSYLHFEIWHDRNKLNPSAWLE
jgi:septal ring factor EnvC (AmiA/AmiB activator)